MNNYQCMVCLQPGERYIEKEGYTYFRCPQCGLLFLGITPSKEELLKFYDEDYFEMPQGKEGAYRCGYDNYHDSTKFKVPFYEFLLKQIKLYAARSVLDVGAAYGSFVLFLKERGFSAAGIEISKFAAQTAQKEGINVIHSSLEEFAGNTQYQNSFDFICMLDVFEHLYDYRSALEGLKLLLKKNGKLLIVTPSSRGLPARILKKRWYHFLPPQHTHLFNPANIAMLLKQYQFDVLRVEYVAKQFSVKYFFHIFAGWVGFNPSKFLNRLFGDWVFTFPLKDNMMVIAQKRNE